MAKKAPKVHPGVRRRRKRAKLRTVGALVTYFVVVALLAALPMFVNTAIGYVPVIAALALFAVDLAYLFAIRRSITFSEVKLASECVRGEELPFALGVENRSFLPAPRVQAHFQLSDIFGGVGREQTRVLTLPPHATRTFDLGIVFPHIGVVRVGIRSIDVYDPLGVFSFTVYNGQLANVAIGPRVVSLSNLEISDQSLRESDKNIKTYISDGMDYAGIREYQWGDPMKSIHWKLSSKTEDDYLTRLYETPTTPGIALFMDLECPSEDPEALMYAFDAVVESALSIELFASSSGYNSELLFVDSSGAYQRIEGPLGTRYGTLMARIPIIRTGGGKALMGLLRAEARSTTRQNNLIVVTPNVGDELVSVLGTLRSPTCAPLLVAVCTGQAGETSGMGEEQKAQLRKLDASGVPYIVVRSAADLRGGARL